MPLGSIPELPAVSCKEIKMSEGQAVSKKYWLSILKRDVPVLAPCDMKTEGEVNCLLVYNDHFFISLYNDHTLFQIIITEIQN